MKQPWQPRIGKLIHLLITKMLVLLSAMVIFSEAKPKCRKLIKEITD